MQPQSPTDLVDQPDRWSAVATWVARLELVAEYGLDQLVAALRPSLRAVS